MIGLATGIVQGIIQSGAPTAHMREMRYQAFHGTGSALKPLPRQWVNKWGANAEYYQQIDGLSALGWGMSRGSQVAE